MLLVKKVKEGKEQILPLLALSGKSIKELKRCLSDCDLYVLTIGQITVSAALVEKKDELCNIIAIATDAGHRNMGYAARLVDYLKDDYARSASFLMIHVTPSQATPFYRLGFSKAEETKDSCTLVKNLKELD